MSPETVAIVKTAQEIGDFTMICSYDRTERDEVLWVNWKIVEAVGYEIRSPAVLEHGKKMKAALEQAHKNMFMSMGLETAEDGFDPPAIDSLVFAAPVAVAPEERGPLLYRKDHVSMDHIEDPCEAASDANGHIKWDGCNEVNIEAGHTCRGPESLKRLLDACVEACTEAGKLLTSREWEDP